MRTHRHLGAYGLAVQDQHVLLIRKGRGPYTGSWDLPGGGIEFGESPADTVRRELIEETNLRVQVLSLLNVCHIRFVHVLPNGESEDLQHIGIIYQVEVDRSGPLRVEPDGTDSLGARWLPLNRVAEEPLTPFARQVLRTPAGAC